MHLVLHVGAHGTDAGRIAAWLARNREALQAQGLVLPPPGPFLRALSEALDKGRDQDPFVREEALLSGLGATGQRRRMLVSAPGVLGAGTDALAAEGFYRRDVARRLHALAVLFPRTRLTLLLAVGRAQSVIPALLPDEPGAAELLLAGITEETLPWARLAHAIRAQLPRAGLVVWRTDDQADVWPKILRALVGPEVALPVPGLFDLAARGLGAEARLRAQRYLAGNPPASARQLRDVVAAFGKRFGTQTPEDPARNLPGWLRERLARLDRGFATEWADLSGMAGVTCLHARQG